MKVIARFICFVFCILVTYQPLSAQQFCGSSFNSQYALMNVWNKNNQTEDVWLAREINFEEGFYGIAIHEQHQPIEITTGRSYALRASVFNRRCDNKWGFGVRGWFFNSSAPTIDTIRTTKESPGIHGTRIQDNYLFPGNNTRTSTGLSDILRVKDNRLFPWVIDFIAVRSLVDGSPKSGLSMIMGIGLSGFNEQTLDLRYQRIFLDNFLTTTDSTLRHIDLDFYVEDRSLVSYSIMVGPTLGLSGYLREGERFLIQGTIQQTIAFGTAHHEGVSLSVQSSYIAKGDGENTERVGYFGSEMEQLSLVAEERSAISITDVEIGIIIALSRKIALSAGGFLSSWKNVPRAARWSSASSKWLMEKDSPVFAGLSFGATYRMRAF